jgi:hypothetical protein
LNRAKRDSNKIKKGFMKEFKSQLYLEEFEYIFSNKSLRVRGALVTSAFMEGQIILLAKFFLEKHGVKYEPKQSQEFWQSLNILKTNGILSSDEWKNIEKFRKERNKSIHGPFKEMTRPVWEEQNKKVVQMGRPVIENLDNKLQILSGEI